MIKSTGFFRNKSKAIIGASKMVAERFGGEVPRTMEEITQLPGVARKTGNLVLGVAYGITSGIVIDTHAKRVSLRLGLTAKTDAVKVEEELCDIFPKKTWIDMGHRLVLFGRYVCTSKKPKCDVCPLFEVCPEASGEPVGKWTTRADDVATTMAP